MKVLTLNFNDKTYTTGKITTFLSKEALKIQKEALLIGKRGLGIQNERENLDEVDELLSALLEIREQKTWLLCEIYGNKFTAEEVEKALDDEEIDDQINAIILGIGRVISKN